VTPDFPWEFGLDTFGDLAYDASGTPLSQAETIRRVVDEAVLAEQTGTDFFGIGEHHTEDWPMPAGDVVLAAIASRTRRIHLGSAVLVLSSDDPVRVFQRYSTLNALSNGRVEMIIGRGSSTESFPLFGYDLDDYETLFEEKTALFAELLKGGPVTWSGTTRAALENADVVPHLEHGPFPVWIGVGGSPESVVRAARHGFALMLAIIGGPPARSRRSLRSSTTRSRVSGGPHCRSACTPPATSRRPTSSRSNRSGRTTARSSPRSAGSAAGHRRPGSNSCARSDPTARGASAHRKPWLARSRRTCPPWGRHASTSSTASPGCRTTR
jgi:alkanesulfonate monooxygenase SsuD/methylene tetrahydromethanopterin reductase-like flavin-dependent oxidoreductase (luciferase family)